MKNICAVVLAAGQGKRMHSNHAKVLCEVLFKPMLDWVCDAASDAGIPDICVVTGHCGQEVKAHIDNRYSTTDQLERLGTGHAVMQARSFIEAHAGGDVLVLCGDAPLMDSQTISAAYEQHKLEKNAVTVISAVVDDPTGYGRIVRNEDYSGLTAIVEQRDADDATKLIREINSGTYWFSCDILLSVLDFISSDNDQGEYYLTDAIGLITKRGFNANAYRAHNPDVVLGANDRIQLAYLNDRARYHVLHRLMLKGVDIPFPDTVFIGPDVKIEADTQILPNTILKGKTTIGSNCKLGPNTMIADSTIGDNTVLNNVQCVQSTVMNGVTAGPFVQIRPNSYVEDGVKIGDYVEIKNSVIGKGTKVPHLTYVGDSDVGQNVNFGCGCVTVNYDGINKNRCTVGDNAFIGCNTNLIAPVKVGNNAYTAAGSTVDTDVPDNALAIARSRQVNKEDWVTNNRKK